MTLGGLDIGTSGCKLSVFSTAGELLSNHYRPYAASRGAGEHEIDAEALFAACAETVSEASAAHDDLAAIGVTSFGETFVLLDKDDRALLPAMLYTDLRGQAEAAEFGSAETAAVAGVCPHPMYALPKLMWLKTNRPEIFARAKRALLMQDYVVYMLTGVSQIDYSLATRTMGFDIRRRAYDARLFSAAGIDPALLALPVETGTPAGKLKSKYGNSRITVVSGAHDQVAAALGAGALKAGDAVDGTGTVECITPVFRGVPSDPAFYAKGYNAVPFPGEDMFVSYAVSFTGGAALKWYKDGFIPDESHADIDARTPDTPTGLLLLPYFAGAGTPYMDPNAQAGLLGLTLADDRYTIYRAIMEGVAMEMRVNTETLRTFGIRPEALTATGGGARSEKWLQIKADVLGLPISTILAPEAGAAGTAMLAGRAAGVYPSLEEAAKVMVRRGRTFAPDMSMHEHYQSIFDRYNRLYGAVSGLFQKEVIK